MSILNKLAERLKKATPEELTQFAEVLVKRAGQIEIMAGHCNKVMAHQSDLTNHLEDVKDNLADVRETVVAEKAAMPEKDKDGLFKSVDESLAKAVASNEGIAKDMELLHGSIMDYTDEASTAVNMGLEAASRNAAAAPSSEKMARSFERQMEKMQRTMEKNQKAADRRLEELVAGITGGFTKAAAPVVATPSRTAITLEKSADGTGAVVQVPGGGQAAAVSTAVTTVSPVLADGVTPNPEFLKSAEAQGEACQKALRDLKPTSVNLFAGIEELVGNRA